MLKSYTIGANILQKKDMIRYNSKINEFLLSIKIFNQNYTNSKSEHAAKNPENIKNKTVLINKSSNENIHFLCSCHCFCPAFRFHN